MYYIGSEPYIAYLTVQSLAYLRYFSLSFLYISAISVTRGSSGFGSSSKEHSETNILETVNAGLQFSLNMSRQIDPCVSS